MKPSEQGVLANSALYFHIPSQLASNLLFYPLCTGYFYCDSNYECQRSNYDSFLLLIVVKGSGFLTINNQKQALGKGAVVLLDCYHEHHYYTDTGWEILWLHFDGPQSRGYFDEITQQNQLLLFTDQQLTIKKQLEQIFTSYHKSDSPLDEFAISHIICSVLTNLWQASKKSREASMKSNPLKDTLHYISEQIANELSIEHLAKRLFISKYHFIRIFKKETGYTPHEYIVMTRVNIAAMELKSTADSLKEISLRCGFSNESSFCTTFKRVTGETPQRYRHGVHKSIS